MTRPGIKTRSPGPLSNTLPTRPMSRNTLTYWVDFSPMVRGARVQSLGESCQWLKKRYLMSRRLRRYGSRVKQSNQGKGVAPFPTPRSSSYLNRCLWIPLDNFTLLKTKMCNKNYFNENYYVLIRIVENIQMLQIIYFREEDMKLLSQLAWAVEYTNCINAEGKDSSNECPA